MKIKAIFLALLIITGSCSKPSEDIIIATAANVQFVMKDIKTAFEKKYGKKVKIVVGSSGKLTAQIREGAPFDVFVSADTKYPLEIYKNGGAAIEPKVYALGSLVLWSKNLTPENLSFDKLKDNSVKKIAIPNPQNAPYGVAAEQAMQKLNILAEVKSKLVYGESIAQTAQYIISGSVEVGFNALSIVLSPEMKGKGGYITVDSTLYEPIKQAAILLKHSEGSPKKEGSEQFYEFLYSSEAKAIFKKYGYK